MLILSLPILIVWWRKAAGGSYRDIHTNMTNSAQVWPLAGLQGSHEAAFLPPALKFDHDVGATSQNNNDKGQGET
jgi:hypothetical protein